MCVTDVVKPLLWMQSKRLNNYCLNMVAILCKIVVSSWIQLSYYSSIIPRSDSAVHWQTSVTLLINMELEIDVPSEQSDIYKVAA